MIKAIWEQFLTIAREEAGSRVVDTWLKAISLEHWDPIEHVVYVQAPNKFVKDWVSSHYHALLSYHLPRLFNVPSVKITYTDASQQPVITDDVKVTSIIPAQRVQINNQETQPTPLVTRIASKRGSRINSNYRFETYVVGPSNSLAYSAAHAITEKLGTLYNPLFIYGGSGLGKTHLMHAIGNEIKEKHGHLHMVYQSADRFVSEFINAIRFDKMHQFQIKYKTADVLFIDDIQFMSNKEQTQEAFFHIFNALHDAQKQIVFSSDTYPADIHGLAQRLSSRLEWGLVTDVQHPSLETKVAIVQRKAELHSHQISDEVAHFIASRVHSNIRELEGALIRVTAFASLTKQPVTLELARKVLARISSSEAPAPVDFDRVMHRIKERYRYSLQDLRSQDRTKQLSLVRQIAMYLMKRMTDKSLQEIGSFLGRKDHTTVKYAIQKIDEMCTSDPAFGRQVKALEQEISR
ncbi:MAG: chromosomal replication initiator protein DnaA [Candidatus Babeliales bacterium]